MKIGIAAYFFPPDINPRSFRVQELAQYFAKMGHEVDVYIPDWKQDYAAAEQANGYRLIPLKPGFWLNAYERLAAKGYLPHLPAGKTPPTPTSPAEEETTEKEGDSGPSLASRLKTQLVDFAYMGGFTFEFFRPLYKALSTTRTQYDLFISVALPMAPHIRTAFALRKKSQWARTTIAEYGDLCYCRMCQIDHDVLVSANVLVMGGVKIGTGAIIGAGTMVLEDIPPYAIAVSSPARVIRYRFEPELIERLPASRWWDVPASLLMEWQQEFSDPGAMADRALSYHNSSSTQSQTHA